MSQHHIVSRDLTDVLLSVAREYAARRGIMLSTLAYRVHGDPRFFAKIEKQPGSFTVRTYDNMMRWFYVNGGEQHAKRSVAGRTRKKANRTVQRRRNPKRRENSHNADD